MLKKLVVFMVIFTGISSAAVADSSPRPLMSYEVVSLLLKNIGAMQVSDLQGVIYPQVSASDKLAQAMLSSKNISASCTTQGEVSKCEVSTVGQDPVKQGNQIVGSFNYTFYFTITNGQASPTVAITSLM